ncbi:MAG: hypothetical protein KGJ03_00850 [Betaproteobacteria bacterium]|nr:hypothetical protein [Betaproteobacteria bacterium]MBU6511753.1 hypothetical protein [Betaproteobacteria bacterium]MDE1954246.1 hypothetical protein [Betaproteobacteria bacterium]MDE2153299.1 hypothetical protein [Betaproteobacteria bacterium]
MSNQVSEREQLRQAARDVRAGSVSREVSIRGSKVVISRLQRVDDVTEMPEPYPKVDLPPADNYDSWLK